MGYRMVDHGYPFKKIMQGKEWVGRVVKTTDGQYYARIGRQVEAYAATELDAFRSAASKALGFENVGDLREHNRRVMRNKRARRAVAQHAMDEFMRGNTNPLDALFGLKERGNESESDR